MNTLAKLVDETLAQAQRLGFSGAEFAAALYMCAHAAPEPRKPQALFTRTLDKGGLEMLRQRLAQLAAGGAAQRVNRGR